MELWWRSWLEEAIKKEHSVYEISSAKRKAGSWKTCKMSECYELLEIRGVRFNRFQAPQKSELIELGLCFCDAIFEKDYPKALSVSNQIDKWIEEHPVILKPVKEEQECLNDPTQVNAG